MKALAALAVAETGYPRLEQPHRAALARILPAQATEINATAPRLFNPPGSARHCNSNCTATATADGHKPPQPTALSAGDPSVARMARGTRSLAARRKLLRYSSLARLNRATREEAGTLDSARHRNRSLSLPY